MNSTPSLTAKALCSAPPPPLFLSLPLPFNLGGRDKRGGPILTFPARTNHDRIKQEDLSRLVTYLSAIPSEDVRARGFTVVVDMRGSKWDSVKPVLRTLQESFSASIHTALLIKPDTFWQKHKTNLGSAKLSFEVPLYCDRRVIKTFCIPTFCILHSLRVVHRAGEIIGKT